MKRILITGKDSYIGTSVEKWLLKSPEKYQVDTLDVRGEEWKSHDFSKYDVVFHVAGIAHVSTDPKMEDLYYKVNRDLTIEIAIKAKKEGIKQFVFMSSIIIYGDSTKHLKVIDKNTTPKPDNFYGKSKLEAEEGLQYLASDDFRTVVLRPPMIYGKGSKGNFPKLVSIARIIPIFPDIENQRSMLHIDNLCEFIRLMVENNESGIFFPQNEEYVKTSELVRLIGEISGKKIFMIKLLNPIIRLFMNINVIRKVFGNLVYDKEISEYGDSSYQIRTLKESVELSINK